MPGDLPPVLILCGGRGLRLQEHTHTIPKPLVEIGGVPIVWHVVQLYAAAGFSEFVLLTGYLGEQVEAFVAGADWPQGATVRVLDTGLETPTGGRIAKARTAIGGRTFCATYSDGLADLDLVEVLRFHRAHGGLATMTVVQPRSQFGVTEIAGDGRVTGFKEKPRVEDWINGGFFCFEPGALEHIGEDDVLERAPLESLAAAGELRAYRHEGFWDCMDTYKDAVELNDLWESGEAPWRR